MAEDTIEIEVQYTIDDLAKASADIFLRCLENAPNLVLGYIRGAMIGVFSFCFVLFFIELFRNGGNVVLAASPVLEMLTSYEFWSFLILVFFCLWIFTVVVKHFTGKSGEYSCIKKTTRKLYKNGKNVAAVAPRKLVFAPKCITDTSEHTHSEYRWSAVEKIDTINDDLYVFVSSVAAIVVPSRYFKSDEEKQEVFEQLQKWFNDSQKGAVND